MAEPKNPQEEESREAIPGVHDWMVKPAGQGLSTTASIHEDRRGEGSASNPDGDKDEDGITRGYHGFSEIP